MDPVTAIGLTAGAVQFVDAGGRALLASIKLLRDLKEAPKRMSELLQDVDKSVQRVYALRAAVQQPSSALFSHLSKEQMQQVKESIDDAYRATVELQSALTLVAGNSHTRLHGRGKQVWRSVVSVMMERNVELKITRIERLNRAITQDLQITNMKLQAEHKRLATETLASVENGRTSEATKIDLLIASDRALQQMAEDTNRHLAAIQPDVSFMKGAVSFLGDTFSAVIPTIRRIEHVTQLIEEDLGTARAEILNANRQEKSAIEALVQREFELVRTDLAPLRDLVLRNLTNQTSVREENRENVLRRQDEYQRDLANQIGKSLVRCPAALNDACNNVDQMIMQSSVPYRRLARRRCGCKPGRLQRSVRKGRFGFGYTLEANHDPKCRYYSSRQQSWIFSFSIQFLPLLTKAIELTFSASHGAGGCSFGPSIRFYGVVERARSPAFQLLDSFPRKYAQKTQDLMDLRWIQFSKEDGKFTYVWDIEAVKYGLYDLHHELSILLSSHKDSASNNDEYGNTLLHGVFSLTYRLGSIFEYVSTELQNVAELVIDAGVNVHASSTNILDDMALPWSDGFGESHRGTVFETAVLMTICQCRSTGSIPLSRTLERIRENLSFKMESRNFQAVSFRESVFRFLRCNLNLVESYDCSELENAILLRSYEKINRLIREETTGRQFSGRKMSPLELALGWYDGMERLLKAGFSATSALELSIYIGDVASTRILLESDQFPGEHSPGPFFEKQRESEWAFIMTRLGESNSYKIQRAVIQALKSRREALTKFALKKLPKEDALELELSQERVLDAQAFEVYSRLRENGVSVPAKLNPAVVCYRYSEDDEGKIWARHESVYHYFSLKCINHLAAPFNILYENGFQEIDTPDQEGITPLERFSRHLNSWLWREDGKVLDILSAVHWFLDKGARAIFSHPFSYPNVLFYLAITFSNIIRRRSHGLCKQMQLTTILSASLCNPLATDGCDCHCSSAGCLTLHMLWNCVSGPQDHGDCEFVIYGPSHDLVEKWLALCNTDATLLPSCYDVICRLEVFERLGMVHTCCMYRRNAYFYCATRQPMPEEEGSSIWNEQAGLRQHLDLIMKAYRTKWENERGDFMNFWSSWWEKLDVVLPELKPKERCKQHLNHCRKPRSFGRSQSHWEDNRRNAVRREALLKKGYYGLDFLEVIKLHFAEELGSEASETAEVLQQDLDAENCDNFYEAPESPIEQSRPQLSSAQNARAVRDFGKDVEGPRHRAERRRSV